MNVSFDKNKPSAAPAPAPVVAPTIDVQATVTPVPTPAPTAPAATPPAHQTIASAAVTAVTKPVSQVMAPVGLALGDRLPEFNEVIMPRLNLVQNIGDLKDTFPLGAIVFNQSTILFTPPVVNRTTNIQEKPATAPVIITCLGFRPDRFVEQVQGGRGMIVNTEDQVRAAGGTLDYNEAQLKKADGIKYFQRLAEALIAIERPEIVADDGTVFVYPVDGKKYALAMWGMKGTAYTDAAKRVFFTNRSMGCLREGGYPSRSFAFTTRLKTYGGSREAHVPVLLPHKASTPEFMAWVEKVLNPQAEAADGAAQS